MRNSLDSAPRWVLSVVQGIVFGAAMTVYGLVQGHSWQAAVISGVIAGAFFGAVMGPLIHRLQRRARAVVRDTPPDVLRTARRATVRGPLPEDPETRAVTARLVDHQLAELTRRRVFTTVTFAVVVLLYVVLAITRSPWWWLAAVTFGGMLALTLWLPHRLRSRAVMLRT